MEIAALILSILALLVSVWSIWYSHRQAVAAEKANELAEKALQEEKEAQELRLDISVHCERDDKKAGGMYFIVVIENNSSQVATIQHAAVVFANGEEYEVGHWQGQIEKAYRRAANPGVLPATVEPGHSCTWTICEWKLDSFGSQYMVSPDHEEPRWRAVDRIEIQANNKIFRATDGPWLDQYKHGWSSTHHQPKPQ